MKGKLEQARRELMKPKKLAMLVTLLAVALLLWGRLLLKQVPRTATANPAVAVKPAPGDGPGGDNLADLADLDANRPVVRVNLPMDLPRDLFRFDAGGYERIKSQNPLPSEGKSDPEASDEQVRSAAVREAASDLALQSVILGDRPRAVINGQLVAPGEDIDGFIVLEVAARHVLIVKDGIVIRLDL